MNWLVPYALGLAAAKAAAIALVTVIRPEFTSGVYPAITSLVATTMLRGKEPSAPVVVWDTTFMKFFDISTPQI
jgi:hypothetical protein